MFKIRLAAILAMAFMPFSGALAEKVTITDIAGRTIEVEAPVKRVILGEGRFLPTIGILDREDPTARIVGTMGDFEKLDPATYAQYLKAFPSVGDIPRMGSASESTFSVETAIAAMGEAGYFVGMLPEGVYFLGGERFEVAIGRFFLALGTAPISALD